MTTLHTDMTIAELRERIAVLKATIKEQDEHLAAVTKQRDEACQTLACYRRKYGIMGTWRGTR